MAQANCLPSAMRVLITGVNQKSSTAPHFPGDCDFRRSNAAPSIIAVSCHLAWRLA
jgi:hypothetical protein